MTRQSGIIGHGRGYRAARDIDARLRQWCSEHPLCPDGTLSTHDAAELIGTNERSLQEALADNVVR